MRAQKRWGFLLLAATFSFLIHLYNGPKLDRDKKMEYTLFCFPFQSQATVTLIQKKTFTDPMIFNLNHSNLVWFSICFHPAMAQCRNLCVNLFNQNDFRKLKTNCKNL